MKRKKRTQSLEGADARRLLDGLNAWPSPTLEDDIFDLKGKVRLWRCDDGRWTVRAVFRNRAKDAAISSLVTTYRGVMLD